MFRIDRRNPRAVALAQALAPHLDPAAIPEPVHIVIGGDGWMLRCIRETGAGPIYLGLNTGLLGFLLNDVGTDADAHADVAAAIESRRWTVHGFPRLEMTATAPDGTIVTALAVNDVYMERSSGQSAHLRIHIDGEPVIDRLVCDGVIVSTALGSTAYSFSAGGVPCHPMVRAMHLTPIAPHVPRLSPVLVPWTAAIEVETLDFARRPVRAVGDGQDHGPVQHMRIDRAREDIRLAFLEGHQFTRTLIRKILK